MMPPDTGAGSTRTPFAQKNPGIWARLQAATRAFLGPGLPVESTLQQGPDEAGAPRSRLYTPAQNAAPTPRADEPALSPFATLRALAANWDVAAICIHVLKEELMGLDWDIVPADGADKGAAERLAGAITTVKAQLRRPDGDLLLDQWVAMLAGEDLEVGMPVIYRNKSKGGQLLGLDIIQGDTIKPLLDARGRITAFQQIWNGNPAGVWGPDTILYAPRIRRRNSAYGEAPLERVLLAANVALRRQSFDLAYYTDGNIPEALAGTPEGWTVKQIQEFQAWFDSLFVGNDAARRRIKMWPGDTSKIHEFRKQQETTAQQEWLMKIGCAAFGVKPAEIGFTHGVNRGVEHNQQEGQQRTAVVPLARWIEDIFTTIIQADLHQPELRFSYDLGGKSEDRQAIAQTDDLNIKNRIYGPATVRERDGIKLADGDKDLLAPPPPPPPMPGMLPPPTDAAPAEDAPLDDAPAADDTAGDTTADDAAPPAGSNVLTLAAPAYPLSRRAATAIVNWSDTSAPLETPPMQPLAKVGAAHGPGSRGGHFYLDAAGRVHYGTPPSGAAARRHTEAQQRAAQRKAEAAQRKAARAAAAARRKAEAAQRKAEHQAAAAARHALVTARGNARDQLSGLHDLVDMRDAGWNVQNADGYGADKAAANAAAQAAGGKDPKSVFAVVKVNGAYYVVSKPISDLQGERAHNVTSGGSHKTDEATAAAEAAKDPAAGDDKAPPADKEPDPPPPPPKGRGDGKRVAAATPAADLRKWQRKALSRVAAGRRAACPFESAWLPPAQQGAIQRALAGVDTTAAVKAVFAPYLQETR